MENDRKAAAQMKRFNIRKVCASCKYKTIDKNGIRSCQLWKFVVGQNGYCEEWEMTEGLKKAGDKRTGAKIKSREYLMFVNRYRLEEQKRNRRQVMNNPKHIKVKKLRKVFIREYQESPYAIMH